jgi:hypothetical protein
MWHIPGVAGDLVGTAFGVTFGTCVFMAIQVPWDFRRGKITPVSVSTSVASLLGRFPRGAFRRGLVLGAISIPTFALPVVALVLLADSSGMARSSFIATKAALAAIQGAIVTPFIVLAALGDLTAQRSK